MRDLKKFAVLAVAACVLSSTSALALQLQVGSYGDGYGPYQYGHGGEFTLTVVEGDLDLSGYAPETSGFGFSDDSFQSFCLEYYESIYPYQTMDASVSDRAIYGSQGRTGDPISMGTAWLYSQFASAQWETGMGYNYLNRETSARALQNAIWMLEGEMLMDENNAYILAVMDEFGVDLVDARLDANGEYGVSVMNLSYYGQRRQDQLYFGGTHRVPPPVPDGGTTVMLLGVALAGLGFARFRRRAS